VRDRRECCSVRDLPHNDRFRAAAHLDLRSLRGAAGEARQLAHFIGDHGLTSEFLGHVLQPRRDIDGVAERGVGDVFTVTDVADNNVAAIDADAGPSQPSSVSSEMTER